MRPESRAGVVCPWLGRVMARSGSDLQRRTWGHRFRSGGLRGARRRRGRIGRHRPGTRERLPGIRTHRTGFRGRWRLEGYRGPAGLDGRGIHRLRCARVRSTGLRQSTGCCGIWNRHDVLPRDGSASARVSASTSCCAEVPGFGTTESPAAGWQRLPGACAPAPAFERARVWEFAGGDLVVGQPKRVPVSNHSVPDMTKQVEELSDEQATFGRSRP